VWECSSIHAPDSWTDTRRCRSGKHMEAEDGFTEDKGMRLLQPALESQGGKHQGGNLGTSR
jgi:hypothetical protein